MGHENIQTSGKNTEQRREQKMSAWRRLDYLHRSPASYTPIPGGITGPPCPYGYKYGGLALQVGRVSKIHTIKYGLESRGTQDSRGTALARPSSNSKLQTRPLVKEGAVKQPTRDPRHPLQRKLALTSPTNGGRSVGIVCSRT
jgi:hypothetical protein